VATEQPSEPVRLDTISLGKLKGVRKVWQVTACATAPLQRALTRDETATSAYACLDNARRTVTAMKTCGRQHVRTLVARD
jgi:hypothetical protein